MDTEPLTCHKLKVREELMLYGHVGCVLTQELQEVKASQDHSLAVLQVVLQTSQGNSQAALPVVLQTSLRALAKASQDSNSQAVVFQTSHLNLALVRASHLSRAAASPESHRRVTVC